MAPMKGHAFPGARNTCMFCGKGFAEACRDEAPCPPLLAAQEYTEGDRELRRFRVLAATHGQMAAREICMQETRLPWGWLTRSEAQAVAAGPVVDFTAIADLETRKFELDEMAFVWHNTAHTVPIVTDDFHDWAFEHVPLRCRRCRADFSGSNKNAICLGAHRVVPAASPNPDDIAAEARRLTEIDTALMMAHYAKARIGEELPQWVAAQIWRDTAPLKNFAARSAMFDRMYATVVEGRRTGRWTFAGQQAAQRFLVEQAVTSHHEVGFGPRKPDIGKRPEWLDKPAPKPVNPALHRALTQPADGPMLGAAQWMARP